MNEKEELAYALYKAQYDVTGHDCLKAKSWEYIPEYEKKELIAAVEAAMTWLFEKVYLSSAGLQFIGRWEKPKVSDEPKRQVEIDAKIGALVFTTDKIIISMRSALQREWEMEKLLEEYYTLLRVVSLDYKLPAHQNKIKRELDKRAEALGISCERKGEVQDEQ